MVRFLKISLKLSNRYLRYRYPSYYFPLKSEYT